MDTPNPSPAGIRLFVNEVEIDVARVFRVLRAGRDAVKAIMDAPATGAAVADAVKAVADIEAAAVAPSPLSVIAAVEATVAAVKEAAPVVGQVAAAWRGRGMQ